MSYGSADDDGGVDGGDESVDEGRGSERAEKICQ